jgi:uncharacterized protein YndB with AHSA1/START domain
MKWVLIILGGIVVLVGLLAAIGAMLPKGHVTARTTRYNQPPEKIWAAITGVEEFASWRPDVKSVERLPDKNGKPAWKENWTNGTVLPIEVDEWDPPRLMVTRIADASLPFGGTWTYEIAPAEGGAALTITEKGEVYNPIFRLVARLMGHDKTIADYQAALAKKFGE